MKPGKQLIQHCVGHAILHQRILLRLAQAEVSGLNRNRRRKDQPVDRRLSVLRIDNAEGKAVGEITDYEDIPGNTCLYVETKDGQVMIPL